VPDEHASRPSTRSASSSRWASPATSWWSPTSSTTPRTTASGSVPGRGSAAGSIIAYALGITELDPIKHGLLFERFLNPERISMPDIDMDFDERRRGEVIRYATEKYGEDRVAQIVTYGTIKAKQAVKDAARVLGYPFAMGDRITKAMPPPVMGKDVPLAGSSTRPTSATARRGSSARSTRPTPTCKRRRHRQGARGPQAAVGRARGRRDHVLEPLLDVIPIMKREQDGAIITQFDYGRCEASACSRWTSSACAT
jgi:DNA polymerase-3 subunit alpha